MTAKKPPPTQIDKSVAAGLFLAVAVSIGALHWGAGPDRQVLGLAISPFGWKRLIVIQALATLMLSWWSARMLAQWKPAWKAPGRPSCGAPRVWPSPVGQLSRERLSGGSSIRAARTTYPASSSASSGVLPCRHLGACWD